MLAGLLFSLPPRPIHDEAVHFAQAQAFARGDWQVRSDLPIWPTAHLLLAGVLAIAGSDSLLAARATIAFCALLAAVAFHAITAHHEARTAGMKTAQFAFLPIVLPYCALVYTDIPALSALLWMVYGILKRRPAVFCVSAVLAVALRQSNIIWLVAGWAMYLQQAKAGESRARLHAVTVVCALTLVAWIACVTALGGIALGDAPPSRVLIPGLPNIEFAIGLGGLLFAPLFAGILARIVSGARNRRWWIAAASIAAVVALTFSVEHRFNTAPALIAHYLRNRLLFAITHSDLVRLLFAGWVAISALAFARFPFVPQLRRLKIPLYVVAALSLLPLELIEQRYYLPFYACFTAMRAPLSDRAEWIQLAMNVCLTATVVYAATHLGIFL
ncbi:MAG TPA: hypothetical protein VL049_03815 [Candidatus Dormibacteraeota bacterium]|nr:hypothetical protein [Candidatus Dormibacteraeota bacterium]